MKRRWRRVIFTLTSSLVVLALAGLGGMVWLHRSGYLTHLAQDLVHRLSGQDVTIEAITFPAWNVLRLTGVRFERQLPGWTLEVFCPRLEVTYGLQGLRHRRVSALHLRQPVVHLRAHGAPEPPLGAASDTSISLPLARLDITQGTLHVHWQQRTYTLQQIEATARQRIAQRLDMALEAVLGAHAATIRIQGHTHLDRLASSGTWALTADAAALSQLTPMLSAWIPLALEVKQGALHTRAEITLHGQTLQGTLHATLTQGHGQVADIAAHEIALESAIAFEGDRGQGTLTARGDLHLQAARIDAAATGSVTQLALSTPLHLQYAPASWSARVDPKLQTQLLIVGGAIQSPALSGNGPLQLQSRTSDWSVQGDIEIAAPQVAVGSDPAKPRLRLEQLQVQLPLRATSKRVEMHGAHLRAQTGYGRLADTHVVQSALAVQATGYLDLQHQRLTLQECQITLPELGRGSAAGTWHLPAQSVRDVHIAWRPASATALWQTAAAWLPDPYRHWQVEGQTQIDLRAPVWSWAGAASTSPVSLVWHLQDVAFSSPEGVVAGEHLSGVLQATAALATTVRPYAVQGTLTLQPFALLVGRLFAALEKNHITSAVAFNGTYRPQTQRVDFDVAGQFRTLGAVNVQGHIRNLLGSPQYDLTGTLDDVNAESLGKAFWPDHGIAPPPFLQGTIKAQLRLRGQGHAADAQGYLHVSGLRFRHASIGVDDLALQLPIEVRYPLPPTVPDATTLPAAAFGHLRLTRAHLGRVALSEMQTRLALRSDTILFPDDITLSLLGGQVRLQDVRATRLLQPQRHLQLRLQARALDLQKIQQATTALPLRGRLSADLRRVTLRGTRLHTEGAATVDIASGRVRISGLQGDDLFSRIPTLRSTIVTEQPLSLLQLTQIYPIGDIGGTLHFTLDDLTLTAGEPAAFHLVFNVQERGGEKREITLKALNNLLFTTGSAKVDTGFTYRLPYRQFGAQITLRHDTLRLRGLYHDQKGREYFMRAPPLGGGVSIVNRTPENGIPFRDFLRRLKSTVLEGPDIRIHSQ